MKINSADQILSNCKWINSNLLVFDLYSPLMNKSFPTEIDFNPKEETKNISRETIKSIIEFQNLTEIDLESIYKSIWDYIIKYRSKEDREQLGISTIEAAKLSTTICGVGFINEEKKEHTYFDIYFNAKWDMEHGRTVSYYNGKLDDVN